MGMECYANHRVLSRQGSVLLDNNLTDFRKDPDAATANSGCLIEAIVTPPTQMAAEGGAGDKVKVKHSCRRRGIYYSSSSEEESDSERPIKVVARWSSNEACRPAIDEAPVFYPSEEEFKDTISYIASIRQEAEQYGICRIVPPPSWKPPCPLKEYSFWRHAEFATRVQQVDKLQNREPTKKKYRNRCQRKRKRRKRLRFGMTRRRHVPNTSEVNDCAASDTDEKFGFQSGSDFTFESFKKYADDFKEQYFGIKDAIQNSGQNGKWWQPSVEEIEGEYWRIVEKPTEEVEVLYGADLETGVFGSGFPKAPLSPSIGEADPYELSGWNLNNFPRLPGSVLSFESGDISGVLVPWLYIGMCFSSFCWHVEDHHLYSLNYMHFGDPKIWYGVPGCDAVKLEDAMKKHLPELFEEQPGLLHELVTQLSPSVLKSEGVPVFRVIQNSGEFVLTFPRAYHSGFNCGFNCAEAVNVAPMDWLPHGQCAVELYSEQCRKTSVSHDKLLLGAAREAVRTLWERLFLGDTNVDNLRWTSVCGKEGVLTRAIKARVGMEEERRRVSLSSPSQARKMDVEFDSTKEIECFSCFYDLHLSAASCECSPNRFSCLSHIEFRCPCEYTKRYFLFRYSMSELNTLVEALEGNPCAVQYWGSEDLGLVLPSNVSLFKHIRDPKQSFSPNSRNSVENLFDINITNPLFGQKNGAQVRAAFSLESNSSNLDRDAVPMVTKSDVVDLQQSNVGSKRVSSAMNDSWCLDLNTEQPSTESKCTFLDGHGNIDLEAVAIKEEQRCYSDLIHQETLSPCLDKSPCSSTKLLDCDLPQRSLCHSTPLDFHSNIHFTSLKSQYPETEANNSLKYAIEPLHFGTIMSGEHWCSREAIFPKGFKSRARYFSVLDPSRTCNYISEVVDAGFLGPVFKVTVEEIEEVTFTQASAMKCWNMVRERVNQEITRQSRLGKQDLPPLQPQGTVDGLEMFGLLSPSIVQVIESLDPNCRCSEYWASRSKRSTSTELEPKNYPAKLASSSPLVPQKCPSVIKLFGVNITGCSENNNVYN